MSFPEDLDMDRVLAEALSGIQISVNEWLAGAPDTEEPLMNRLTAQFTRRRRQCDVGVRVPVTMTSKVAFLHRKGLRQTDAFGADLAITIEIPDRGYCKTALFQIKVSQCFSSRLERRQLNQSLADDRTRERSFVLVADKTRQRMRVKSVTEAIQLIDSGHESAEIDCVHWMAISEWITKWLSCDIGQISGIDDPRSIENLLQSFIVKAPETWETPWGDGNAIEYPGDQVPAKAWLVMIFRRTMGAKENKRWST